MKTDEIREAYLSFFEERGHLRVPSASLIPPPEDTSTLLTVAGMQPFKPYFRGEAEPPSPRVADSQKCFRTPDIEQVGNTRRHLTFFEMLGNWSFGDYFKEESIAWGLELSVDVFGLDPEPIWVSVFGGDEELGPRAGHRGDRDLEGDGDPGRSGSSSSRGRRTSGRRGRPGPAAPARRCTWTAARSSAAPTSVPATTPTATSSTGTTSS